MATSTSTLHHTTGSDTTIVGYFANGEDAHRAINALLDDGFLANQIGAAFHVGSEHTGSESSASVTGEHANLGSSLRSGLGTTLGEGRIDGGARGPGSDDTGIAPGVTSGAGTGFLGAGRPGPISGSDLSHLGLKSELRSELAHDLPHESTGSNAGTTEEPEINRDYAETHAPASHLAPAPTHAKHGSWFEKLKHVFEPHASEKHTTATHTDPALANKTSQSFGTGEGYINLAPETSSDFAYSQPAFESSFSGFGVPTEHARHLSHRLRHGGAVVTVGVTGRAVDVEKIFERHNGRVRLETEDFNEAATADDHRVEVFGSLGRAYGGHVGGTTAGGEKL